jgi:hypothetical protein
MDDHLQWVVCGNFTPLSTSFTYKLLSEPGANADASITTPKCDKQAGSPLVASALVATFTTVRPHGLAIGQGVNISGANPGAYNGSFFVDSVPAPTTFTYVMNSAPGANANQFVSFGAIWQIGRLIIENNVIELALPIFPSDSSYHGGIVFSTRFHYTPPYH